MNRSHFVQAMQQIREHNARLAEGSMGVREKYMREVSDRNQHRMSEIPSFLPHAKLAAIILRDAMDPKTGLLPISTVELCATYTRILRQRIDQNEVKAYRHQLMFQESIPGLCSQHTKQYKAVLAIQIKNGSFARCAFLQKRLEPFFHLLHADDAPLATREALAMLDKVASWMVKRPCRLNVLGSGVLRSNFACNQRTASWLASLYNKMPGTPLPSA